MPRRQNKGHGIFHCSRGVFPDSLSVTVSILILPVPFSGLRTFHPNPMVFNFILRVLFLSPGNPGGGGYGVQKRGLGVWQIEEFSFHDPP